MKFLELKLHYDSAGNNRKPGQRLNTVKPVYIGHLKKWPFERGLAFTAF
jgi:hypothetical protein